MMRMLALLLSLAMSFQEARAPGPGGNSKPLTTPTLDSSCAHDVIGAGTNNCTLSITTGDAIVVNMYLTTGGTLTALKTCSGTTSCSTTTDTLTASVPCAAINGQILCQYYICVSALTTGSIDVTMTVSPSATNIIEAETWTGMIPTGCLDAGTPGTAGTTSTNPTVTTSGNISAGHEVVIGFVNDAQVPTVGGSYTQIQTVAFPGHSSSMYSTSPPASGSPATANWTATSGAWRALVSAFK